MPDPDRSIDPTHKDSGADRKTTDLPGQSKPTNKDGRPADIGRTAPDQENPPR